MGMATCKSCCILISQSFTDRKCVLILILTCAKGLVSTYLEKRKYLNQQILFKNDDMRIVIIV